MPYAEYLSPEESGASYFNSDKFWQDLALREHDTDQPFELEMYLKHILHRTQDPHVESGGYYIANGIAITESSDGTIAEYPEEFYGRITKFSVREMLGRCSLIASMYNDENGENVDMLVSTYEGFVPEFIPELSIPIGQEVADIISDVRDKTFELSDFLSTVALKVASLDSVQASDYIRACEQEIADRFNIQYGSLVHVTGIQAFVGNGEKPITQALPDLLDESCHVGAYLGLASKENTIANQGGTHNRLCIVLQLQDKRIVLQPCAFMRSAVLIEA